MAFEKLVEVIHSSVEAGWKDRNEAALASLFGSAEGRYPQAASAEIALRAPAMGGETGVPFAAYIHPSNPPSGAYSGLSFVIFPADGAPCLLGLVVGTQGLTPDEAILGRPRSRAKRQKLSAATAKPPLWQRRSRCLGETGPYADRHFGSR